MGSSSVGRSTTTAEKFNFRRGGEDWRAPENWPKWPWQVDCTGHVDLFKRLHRPHDGHVIRRQEWINRPWTWRNYVACGLNRFYDWLESGK